MEPKDSMKLLSGIKILDFTTFLSGPFATQTLGDLGAEIIKIESLEGDSTRPIPPYFAGEDSMYYMSTNRNKQSLAVNLKSEKGRKIIYQLLDQCDMVIENFRPGVTERLGIDFATVKQYKPNIIYCSITGFGQDGPYRNKPAYDMIVQALSGSMSLTGEKNGDPVRLGVPLGDLAAGLYAVIGTLGALQYRNQTGKGRYIDISMLDCQLPLLSYLGAYYLFSGTIPSPQGREHDSIPTYRAIKSGDGEYVFITANTQKMYEGVCQAVEREDLITNEKYLTGETRLSHKNELVSELEKAFSHFNTSVLLERLEKNGVPCAPIHNLQQAVNDPQVLYRNMIISTEHPLLNEPLQLIGNPVKYNDCHSETYVHPPLLGEHTESLLLQLGYSREEIDQLIVSGTVKMRNTASAKEEKRQ